MEKEDPCEKVWREKVRPQFFHCGCCEQYHSTEFWGDCRNDSERFNPEELDEKYGRDNWAEVEQD